MLGPWMDPFGLTFPPKKIAESAVRGGWILGFDLRKSRLYSFLRMTFSRWWQLKHFFMFTPIWGRFPI